jgi:hypothetical protein
VTVIEEKQMFESTKLVLFFTMIISGIGIVIPIHFGERNDEIGRLT